MKTKKGSKTVEGISALLLVYAVVSIVFSILTKASLLHNSFILLLCNPFYWFSLQYSLSVSGIAEFLALIGFPSILLIGDLLLAVLSD